MRPALCLIANLVCAAGCTLGPVPPRPEVALAPSYPTSAASAATAAPVASRPWATHITDARTQALIHLALQSNADLRLALANVEQARALQKVAQAEAWPSLGLAMGGTRNANAGSYSAGLSLSSYELDWMGRVQASGQAATARLEASQEAARWVRLQLLTSVAETELALRGDEAQIGLLRAVLASRQATLSLVQHRQRAGWAALPEVHAQEALVAATEAGLAAQERLRLQRINALVLLLGRPLPADLPAAQALLQHEVGGLPAGLPSDLLLTRPDVRQAEAQLHAAQANVEAARAAFFPRISLTGSAGVASTALNALFDKGAWSLSASLLQPLFDGGRNRGNLQANQAAVEAAAAQYQKTVQTAFKEVADALAAQHTLTQQWTAANAQAQAETRRLEQVTRLHQAGMTGALELLDAQRSHLAAQQALLQVVLSLKQNQVSLYRVLGGELP